MSRLYNRAIFLALMAVLLPGYSNALVLGRAVDVTRWMSVFLIVLLGGHFLVRRGKSVYILLLAVLFACALLLGVVNGSSLSFAANHALAFAPFIIAFLMLELRVGIGFATAFFWISVCGAAGAVAANVIHVFRPDLLGLLVGEDNVGSVINVGRVNWAGYVITLPVVAQLGFLDLYPSRRRHIVVACIAIVLAGALLTFNRTLTVALVLLFGYLFYTNWRQLGLKAVAGLAAVGVAGAYFVAWWGAANPIVVELARNRFMSFFSGAPDVTTDVSVRVMLYEQYAERLKSSYLLGKGIGVPVSTVFGDAAWADITLVTFAIPFGIAGVLVFLLFLRRLYARIRTTIDEPRVQRLFTVVFLLGIAISLNDDIWSHKYFVVFLVYLVNSYSMRAIPGAAAVPPDDPSPAGAVGT